MEEYTRAVIIEKRDGTLEVSVLVRIGRDTWRSSCRKPVEFSDMSDAIEYGKKNCDEVI
jgi:hypothetical protein